MSTARYSSEVWHGERQATGQALNAGQASSPQKAQPTELVAGIEERQAERDRLLSACRQFRARHRCPERCVFTGELRRSGLAVFDELS